MPPRAPKPRTAAPAKPAAPRAGTAAKPAEADKPREAGTSAKPETAAMPAKHATPARPAKPARPVDPYRLLKREDGYVSADGRFEISGTSGSFYLADAARPNPFGLPTIDGPYRTLTELRAAVAAAVQHGGTRG